MNATSNRVDFVKSATLNLPVTFERKLIIQLIHSPNCYHRIKGEVCPPNAITGQLTQTFRTVRYNSLFQAIAVWHETQQQTQQAIPKEHLQAALIDRNNARLIPPDSTEALLQEIDEDFYAIPPAAHDDDILGVEYRHWLDWIAGKQFADEIADLVRTKPTSLDQFRLEMEKFTLRSGIFNGLPSVVGADDLVSDERITTPPEIIAGLLHAGMKMSFSSASKGSKTWLALDMATAVATGGEFLGFKCTKTEVLYLNLEISQPFFKDRLKTVLDKKGLESAEFLNVWSLRGHVVNLETLLPRLIAEVKRLGAGLVVVDPVYKLLTGADENATGDISRLCNQLDRLASETGAAVVYVGHFSKGNQAAKSSIDRLSGSGVYARDADSIVTLTPHEQDNCAVFEFVLRNNAPVQPFVVEWQYPMFVRRDNLNPAALKTIQGRKSTDIAPELVLKLVPGCPGSEDEAPITKDDLEAEIRALGCGINKAREIIADMVTNSQIFKWTMPRPGARPIVAYHQQAQSDNSFN